MTSVNFFADVSKNWLIWRYEIF